MPNIEAAKTLKAARELISRPGNWTKGWYAKDIHDQSVYSKEAVAVKWCATGALTKANGPGETTAHLILRQVIQARGYPTVPQYNDTHEHDEVLSAFDEAIEIAEKENNDDN